MLAIWIIVAAVILIDPGTDCIVETRRTRAKVIFGFEQTR